VLEGIIGRGASGTVFRARETALDREVALKVLHPEVAKNKQTVRRLQREARTTARLGHPHIVSAIAIGETEGTYWYAMGLIDGPSLGQVLRQDGRLREREALRYFIPLCEALEHLWEHGVVHRDIKPANILIDHTAGAQLADLGLAFADDDPALTSQGATLGTPHYISPEQAVDPTRADVRSDIWSFGATLYHAVCGRPPFHGDSTAEVLSSVLHARVPDPLRFEPALSRGLTLILRKCLTRDPAERYQTPRELLLDLERVRERRAPKVVKSQLDPIETEPRPWVRPAIAAGAIAIALGTVYLVATRMGAPSDGGLGDRTEIVPQRLLPLEALAKRANDDVEPAGPILREVEELRSRVPAELVPDWEELHGSLRASLRADVTGACDTASERVDRLIKAGDFLGARRVLEVDLPAALASATGLVSADLEDRFAYLKARRAELATRLESAQRQHVELLGKKIPARVDALIAEAEALVERRRFQSALAELDVDDEGLFDDAGYAGWRFEPALVSEILGQARVRLNLERDEVRFAWRDVDADLRAFVSTRAASLREDMPRTEEPHTSAADDLEASFENELFERELERDEMALGVSRRALDHLAEAKAELREYEDELRDIRFRETFDLNRELDQPIWRRREYDAVLTLWTEFAESLAKAPGDATRRARTDLVAHASARIAEARLLEELMQRAADGVLALDGQRRDMRVLSGGIVEEGRIEAGLDPLREGFQLVPDQGGPFTLRLQTMSDRDLLRFAGVSPVHEDLTATERLMVAAFRYHEGNLAAADATLSSGPPPDERALAALASDLRVRILEDLAESKTARVEREGKVRQLLDQVTDEAMAESPVRAMAAIETLLTEYADDRDVRLKRAVLLERREQLLERTRNFDLAYGPDVLEEQPDGSVRMRFEFDEPNVGAWEALSWRYEGAGWSSPRVVKDWETLARDAGAQLILRPPLNTARDVEVKVRFEVIDESAPPQLLLVSLLGFHAALTGPGLPVVDRERHSRWMVRDGAVADALDELRRGKGEETTGRGLRRGEEQELVLRVNAQRGEASLSLDGTLLGSRSFRGRGREPASLVLRSWDPIRVLSIELSGSR